MSLKKIDAIAKALRAGTLTLTDDTARQLNKAAGRRFAADERAALLTIERDIELGMIKTDPLGAHRFLDKLETDPQSRVVHGLRQAQTFSRIGQGVATAIGSLVGGALGLAGGPGVMVTSAAAAAATGFLSGSLIGGLVGLFKGLLED